MLRVTPTASCVMHMNEPSLNGKKLVQWLNVVSKDKVFSMAQRSVSREKNQQNLLWFNSATFHPLEEWLANQLEKTILDYYFNPRDRFDRIRTLKRHMLDKGAPKSLICSLQLTIEDMHALASVDRLKIAESLKSFEESVKDQIEEEILNIETEAEKKKKKKRRNKKPKKDTTSLQKEAEKKGIFSCDQNNQEFNTTDTLKIDLTEEQQVLKPLLEKADKVEDNNQVDMSQVVELTWEQTHTEIMTKSFNATNITLDFEGQSPMKERRLDHEFDHHDLQSINGSNQNSRLHRNSSHKHLGSTKLVEEDHLEDDKHQTESITISNGETSDLKTRKKKKRKGQKSQNKLNQQFKSTMVSLIINKQLNNMLDSLSMQSNSSYESKVIAFQRVRYFVKSLCPYGQALLFGSNAVGLSLPSSDIDIMLVDMHCKSKQDICECLGQIAIYIDAMGWVTSCSTYFGAKVPLVKLQIDPSVGYFTPKCKSEYFNPLDQYTPCCLDMKDPSRGVPIKIDITISTEQGKVSGSTELMRSCLEQNTSLQRVLLALKYTLSVRGYSQNFKGGIGSYCLFVMVAAYFKQFKEVRQNSDCEILLDILKFYGQDFQNQLKVVTLTQNTSTSQEQSKCFISNQQASNRYQLPGELLYTNLLKIIDPLYDKLMSSSCYQFNCIKSEWRHIRSQILKVEELVESQIDSCFSSPAQISKVLANKKLLDRWANRFMGRIDFSIASIIERSV